MRSIRTLLVANRGEIARRVFATCRRLGISTVAVYSDADSSAPFVAEADTAVALGGVSPADSYLKADAIIEAALRTGADAIHPGYGFLSESPGFAAAVADAGLIWVGPQPEAIEAMGSKLISKEKARESGVPVLNDVDLTACDDQAIAKEAEGLAYPVLVKASAGGGGKGMQVVESADGLVEAVNGARRLAESAFGDPAVFVEPLVDRPRHVEVQVLGDQHGRVVPVGERECSVQRRHQKVIEEAPSPNVTPQLAERLAGAAVALAESVAYQGAGTVEFLVSGDEFWLLEMNTRLQVEHPVTEMVYGVDLVEWQLRIACGEQLPDQVGDKNGHAIEARLYAEDPSAGFLPSPGRIARFRIDERVRVDSGVEDGSEISAAYDPMMAKVIAHGRTRAEAAAVLAASLRSAAIAGPVTNRDLLVNVLEHEDFLDAEIDTGYLDREDLEPLCRPLLDTEETKRAAAAVTLIETHRRRHRAQVQATIPVGWRNVPSQLEAVRYTSSHGQITVDYGHRRHGLVIDGYSSARVLWVDNDEIGIELDGVVTKATVISVGQQHHVATPKGTALLVEQRNLPVPGEEAPAPGTLLAPMPGTVVAVNAAVDDLVEDGHTIVVLEAMKMEHTLRAPHRGTITELPVAVGDQVEAGAIIAVVEAEGD